MSLGPRDLVTERLLEGSEPDADVDERLSPSLSLSLSRSLARSLSRSLPLSRSLSRALSRCLSAQGSGFRVKGSGFRVQGLGCRVQGGLFAERLLERVGLDSDVDQCLLELCLVLFQPRDLCECACVSVA